jgi:hypothetical protein
MVSIYPVLFSGGSILFAALLNKIKINFLKKILVSLIFSIILICGLFFANYSIHFLPIKYQLIYYKKIGVSVNIENGNSSQLPQWIADQFGWEELAQNVSKVYNKISNDEKDKTLIIAANYGEAGALQFYSNQFNLPPVISPHNNFYYWGINKNNAEIYITIGIPEDQLNLIFNNLTKAGYHSAKYIRDHENNLPIYICKNAKVPINSIWVKMKWFGGSFRKTN